MRHYHVRTGDHGYLPNINYVYTNRADAKRAAEWWLNELIGAMWQNTTDVRGERLLPKRRERIAAAWMRSLKTSGSVNLTEVRVGAQYVGWEACEYEECLEHTHRCSRNGWHRWECKKRACFNSTRMDDGVILEWECKGHVS